MFDRPQNGNGEEAWDASEPLPAELTGHVDENIPHLLRCEYGLLYLFIRCVIVTV